MWPILLKILTIIGIVLACILGVVIILLLLVLLCPITYKVTGSAHDNEYKLTAKLKYLFGIVRAGYDYPEPGIIYAKVLNFTLYSSKEDTSDNKENKTKNDTSDNKENKKNSDNKNDKDISANNNIANSSNSTDNNKEVEFEALDSDEAESKSSNRKKHKKNKDKASGKKLILNPIYHIKRIWENFRFKVVNKIQFIIKDIKYFIALWEHDDTQELVRIVKKHGIKLLKLLAPKKGNIKLVFGTGSPDTTGEIYGLCCAIFTRWPKNFFITPDFDNKIIDGDLMISGHFNLLSVAIQVVPILLSKKLRLTKARFDNHSEKKKAANSKALKKHEKILRELEEEYS